MATRYQPEYRKKKRVKRQKEAPFPVPISSITNIPCDENFWFHFTGYLQNDSVMVIHTGDAKYLYKMGFFGRGLLSRGATEFHETRPYVYLPTETGSDPNIVDIMKRRMYLRHKHWQKLQDNPEGNTSVTEEDMEFDSDLEYDIQDVQQEDMEGRPTAEETVNLQPDNVISIDSEEVKLHTSPRDWTEVKQEVTDRNIELWDTSDTDAEFWTNEKTHESQNESRNNVSSNKEAMMADWDNCEADEDFWGSESTSTVKPSSSGNKLDSSDLESFNQGQTQNVCDDQPPNKKRKVNEDAGIISENRTLVSLDSARSSDNVDLMDKMDEDVENIHSDNASFKCITNMSATEPNREPHVNDNKDFTLDFGKDSDACNDDGSETTKNTETVSMSQCSDNDVVGGHSNNELGDKSAECDQSSDDTDFIQTCDIIATNSDTKIKEEVEETLNDLVLKIINQSDIEMDCNKEEQNDIPESEMENHPYCDTDDSDGDYLVIDDSDYEGHVTNQPMKKRYHWKSTMKKDPFPYTEPLILTSEEAFFLSYGLGCLSVLDSTSHVPFTLKELWCRFCKQPGFLPRYTAYHYFRSRGWVPRSGALFGTDFVLYKEGPPFFHGSYSVLVKAVYAGTYNTAEEYPSRNLTWAAFSGLQRITEHVAKTLLMCYVVIPPDLSDEEKASPNCLSKIRISLQRFTRWVASQEREQDRVTDIP